MNDSNRDEENTSFDQKEIKEITAIEQFCNFTGADKQRARATLEACNWNVELAINMHVDGIETGDPAEVSPVIEMPESYPTTSSSSGISNQEIRPPIPPVRQVLVEDIYSGNFRTRNTSQSVFDAFRNFQEEARWFESGEDASYPASCNKRSTLEELFRPPLSLLFRGSMSAAREYAVQCNKWLMVNVQNVQEFSCQVLNRDVWSNPAVKEIITEHFVFWQVYHDSSEGQRYMQFYNVIEFPYVAILDPRTGEKLRSWSTGIDYVSFCELVTEFLSEFPSPDGSTSNDHKNNVSKSYSQNKNLYEDTEEAQLKAAIAASLQDTAHCNNQNSEKKNDTDEEESEELETFDSDTDTASNSKLFKLNINKKIEKGKSNLEKSSDATTKNWKMYLGPDNGKYSELIIRFPDGKREQISFPAESKLKILFSYIASKGYNMDDYDLVTCFPKKNLKELSFDETLYSIGLFPRETVFVHLKS